MNKALLLAVVVILAISSSSFAAVVYSGSQNVTVGVGESAGIQIAGATGVGESWDDFSVALWIDGMAISAGLSEGLPMSMIPGGTLTGVVGDGFLAWPVLSGDPIGPPASMFDTSESWRLCLPGVLEFPFGSAGGYIGLQMDNLGALHYGWLHMSGTSLPGSFPQTMTFDGWAYEDIAGVPIAAGDTGTPVVPVPGALVLGSVGAGLVAWRRRRRAA